MKDIFFGLLFGFMLGAVVTTSVPKADTTYYQPAEIVAYNDTSVYFGTENNNIFYLTTCGLNYPDTVPYLLHMDSMGTDDVSDDKILVAWRCVE